MNGLLGTLIFLLILFFVFLVEKIIKKIVIRILSVNYSLTDRRYLTYVVYPIRIILGFLVIYSFFLLIPLPEEFLLTISLVLGTAITIASYHTVQNFTSGIFILLSKPFEVDDIIIVDGIVGQVEKISLNYVKIKTFEDNFVVIPNKQINKSMITTFKIPSKEQNRGADKKHGKIKPLKDNDKIKKYIFEINVPINDLTEINEKFDSIVSDFLPIFGFKPEYFLFSMSNKLAYKFVIHTAKPETFFKDILQFRNKLLFAFY